MPSRDPIISGPAKAKAIPARNPILEFLRNIPDDSLSIGDPSLIAGNDLS